MASGVSTSKLATLLSAVQLNPEIGADDSAFIESVIQRAARFITSQIHVDRYPELSQGTSVSGSSASTDLESAGSNEFLISIDDDSYWNVEITLSGLTSGAAIAAELQTQIQAIAVTAYKFVTVSHSSSMGKYTITSPTFGESSFVSISYDAEFEHVARDLQLSPGFGGVETGGGDGDEEYDDMVIALVTHWYRRVGVEGMKAFSIPGSGSYTEHDIDPVVKMFIDDNRRLVV